MVIRSPLLDIRPGIRLLLPLNRVKAQVRRDCHLNGVIEADVRHASIKVSTDSHVKLRMDDKLKGCPCPRLKRRGHVSLPTIRSASDTRSSPETSLGSNASRSAVR